MYGTNSTEYQSNLEQFEYPNGTNLYNRVVNNIISFSINKSAEKCVEVRLQLIKSRPNCTVLELRPDLNGTVPNYY